MLKAAALGCALAVVAHVGAFAQTQNVQIGGQTFSVPDRTTAGAAVKDYRLGPLDKISVNVFGQPNLSVEKIQVDAGGEIVLPLIGGVQAGGRTAQELSREIARRLGENYLQAPQVSVLIEDAVSQRVTVAGAVVESGVYALKGPTTLMQAIAMAKGPDNKIANLKQVAVFRNTEAGRTAARFDLKAIRDGKAIDPEIIGGDTIVVGGSSGKTFWRELVSALPGIGAFAYF